MTKQSQQSKAFKRTKTEYLELVYIQSTMPENMKWTLGPLIREAKIRAYVEAEASEA